MASKEPLPPCRYRVDDSTSATVTLPDGRKLGYAEYGNPTGYPIIYHPGWPSARTEGTVLDKAATKLNARIISIDRPGYGLSTPHEARTLKTYAEDIEVLTNHLKLDKYASLGISGGGPYTLACARYLPANKLRAMSMVCGLGPPDIGYWGMAWPNYLGWTFCQRLWPSLGKWYFGRMPGARMDLPVEERFKRMREGFDKELPKMHPKDRKFFDVDWMVMRLRSDEDVYRNGMDAFAQDWKILNSNFGFKVEEIRKDLPVFIWQGHMDLNVPPKHAKVVAQRIGQSAKLRMVDETHASISSECVDQYLGELVKSLEG